MSTQYGKELNKTAGALKISWKSSNYQIRQNKFEPLATTAYMKPPISNLLSGESETTKLETELRVIANFPPLIN